MNDESLIHLFKQPILAYHFPNPNMKSETKETSINRRSFLGAATATLAAAGASAMGASRDWTGVTPTRYPDPDIIALDPRFTLPTRRCEPRAGPPPPPPHADSSWSRAP